MLQTIGWLVGKQQSSALNAYMQWKPVCYTSAKPSIKVVLLLIVLIYFCCSVKYFQCLCLYMNFIGACML